MEGALEPSLVGMNSLMALLRTKEKLVASKEPGDMHQWNHLNIYSQLASVQRSLHDSANASLESPTGASHKKTISQSDGELKTLEYGLAYLARVSALEKLFTNLVNAASARTSALAECSASGAAGRLGSPLRHAWDWLQLVQRCTLLHMRDAAEYHQLHQEVSELLADVDAFEFVAPPAASGLTFGELATATRGCVSESVRLWMSLERLYRSAGHLRPVHLRVGGGSSAEKILAGRALCAFASAELRLCESDELLLVDRSDPYLWRVRWPSGEEGVVPSVCLQIVSPDLHSMERVKLARAHAFQRWRHVLHAALLVALRLYESALSSFSSSSPSSTSSSSTAKQDAPGKDAGAEATGQRESPKEKRLQDERVKEKDSIQREVGAAASSSSSARSADKANAKEKEGGGQELSRFLFDLDTFLQTVLASRAGAQDQNGHDAPAKEKVRKSFDASNSNSNGNNDDDGEEVVALCRRLRQHCLRALTASCSQSRTVGSANASGSVNEEAKEVARLRLTLAQLSDMSKLLATLKELWMHHEASALQMRNRSFVGQMAVPPARDLSSHLIHALEVYRTVLEGGLENVAAARARSSSSGPPGARLSTYVSGSSSGSRAAEHKRSTSTARAVVKHSAGAELSFDTGIELVAPSPPASPQPSPPPELTVVRSAGRRHRSRFTMQIGAGHPGGQGSTKQSSSFSSVEAAAAGASGAGGGGKDRALVVTHFEMSAAGGAPVSKMPEKRNEHVQCRLEPAKRDEHVQSSPEPEKRDEHVQSRPEPAKRDEHVQCGPPKPRAKPNKLVVIPTDRFEQRKQQRLRSESSDWEEEDDEDDVRMQKSAPTKAARPPPTQVEDTSKSTIVREQERLAQAVLEQKAAVGELRHEHAYIQTDSMKVAIERYRRTELIDETFSIAIGTEDLKPLTEDAPSIRRGDQSQSQKAQERSDSKATQSDPYPTRQQATLTEDASSEIPKPQEGDSKATQSDPYPTQQQATLTEIQLPLQHAVPEEAVVEVRSESGDVGSLAATRWRSLANDFLRDDKRATRNVQLQSGASAFQQDSALRDSTLQTLPPVLFVNNSGTQTEGLLPAMGPAREWMQLVRVDEAEDEKPDTVARSTQTSPLPELSQERLVQQLELHHTPSPAFTKQTEPVRPVSRSSLDEEQQFRRSPQPNLMSTARLVRLTPPPPQMKELGVQVDMPVDKSAPRRAPVTRSKPQKDVEALLREMGVEFGRRRGVGTQVTPMVDEASMETAPHTQSESTQTKSHELGYRLMRLSEFASLSGASSPPTLHSVTTPLNVVIPTGRGGDSMFSPNGLNTNSPKEPSYLHNGTTHVPEPPDESPPLPEEMVKAASGSNAHQFSFFPAHLPHSRQRSPTRISEAFSLKIPRKKRLQANAPVVKSTKDQNGAGNASETSTLIPNQKPVSSPLALMDLNTAIF